MKELKGNSGITYRLATQEDFFNWYGGRQKYGAKAYIFFKGEEAVGIGGYKKHGDVFYIFSEIKESVILDKLTIYRAGKLIVSLIEDLKFPVFAESKNVRLCEILGGKRIGEELYKW